MRRKIWEDPREQVSRQQHRLDRMTQEEIDSMTEDEIDALLDADEEDDQCNCS